jgi:hypothetical protein
MLGKKQGNMGQMAKYGSVKLAKNRWEEKERG